MRILVVGGGGREHALVWRLSRSGSAPELHAAPGNAGIAELATCHDVPASDVTSLVRLAKKIACDLVVVGPEQPLCDGLVDALEAEGIAAFGPTRGAARLEGDKAWAKELMKTHSIPTAGHRTFTELQAALAYVEEAVDFPMVVKASGLAAGKGVVICRDAAEAAAALKDIMGERRYGSAGETVVIEDFLEGEEVSLLALTDGRTIAVLEAAQDHKRAFDGDEGPNTGGMGAYSPAPAFTPELQRQVEEKILVPIVHALRQERRAFRGVLFAGLMLTRKGPRVLEFNVRFGDPECQALMMRFRGDLAALLRSVVEKRLHEADFDWDPRPAVTVVVAQEGYPGSVGGRRPIRGLEALQGEDDLQVFHAGTRRDGRELIAAGGRVLNVSALGRDFADAARRAYAAIDRLDMDGFFCRRDIAHRVL